MSGGRWGRILETASCALLLLAALTGGGRRAVAQKTAGITVTAFRQGPGVKVRVTFTEPVKGTVVLEKFGVGGGRNLLVGPAILVARGGGFQTSSTIMDVPAKATSAEVVVGVDGSKAWSGVVEIADQAIAAKLAPVQATPASPAAPTASAPVVPEPPAPTPTVAVAEAVPAEAAPAPASSAEPAETRATAPGIGPAGQTEPLKSLDTLPGAESPKANPFGSAVPVPNSISPQEPGATKEVPTPGEEDAKTNLAAPAPISEAPANEPSARPAPDQGESARNWLLWGAGGLAGISGLGLLVRRLRRKSPSAEQGPSLLGIERPETAEAGDTSEGASGGEAATVDGVKVEGLLERGGFCDIFVGRKVGIPGKVVIKTLRTERRGSEALRQGLLQEGEVLRRMNAAFPDEAIVKLLHQGWFHEEGVRHPYLVLEHLDGLDLKSHVRKNGPLELESCRVIGRGLASALAAVHAEGYIHGDVSPENVILLEKAWLARPGSPRFRLIDFGDAQQMSFAKRPEGTTGKPAYLSPEQVTGFPATPASDVYALGMVLYFLAVGRPAFESDNYLETFRMHREAPVEFPPDFPADLAEVVAEATRKAPLARPEAGLVARMLDEQIS